ncbi:uncharacterized protein LOC122264425 isoform X4 [Penaeus japonicus]|uniref:uncharacterized protein LOC122264425 isoform X4 n=1 Tax=Penaeus japonicus TaxID=27405 RepID=UPI001C712896|nr:uncharacterized protein LOC122264425 isoform X4 [Penaeus japonicus]
MPVRGGRAQKRINERSRNYNFENPNSNLGFVGGSALRQHGFYMDLEELDEIEALLEREQELLGQQDHSHHTSVNLLHSPDQNWRPPKQFSQRQIRTPRSISRTQGNFAVPQNQLVALTRNMTFSDAEEDHQGSRNSQDASNSGGVGDGSSNRERSVSRSRTESGVSNASTASLVTPLSSAPPMANGQAPTENSDPTTPVASARASDLSNSEMSAAAAAVRNSTVADMKSSMWTARRLGVDSKKIVEKLQQIQGYIQQTTSAMSALEQQGDVGSQSDIYARFATLNQSLQLQEGEYMDILARSLVLNKAAAAAAAAAQAASSPHNEETTTPASSSSREEAPITTSSSGGGNQVVGIVGPGSVRSLQERLAMSQEESQEIMVRMRESIARREDLMTRYKATRERLENLKKQRRGLQEEEKRLLQTAGSTETPTESFENPLPGSENWSNEEIETAITDFQVLYDKVDNLLSAYTAKAEAVDPDDAQAVAEINSKKEQILSKRRQLIESLTCLRGIQQRRAQEGSSDGNEAPSTSTSIPQTQTNNVDPGHTPRGTSSAGSEGATASTRPLVARQQQSPPTDGEAAALSGLRNAVTSVNMLSDEMTSKRSELQSLQKQLGDMKKLLEVTTAARQEDEKRMLEAQQRLAKAENEHAMAAAAASRRDEQMEGAVGGEIVGVDGRKIQLSESERQNPEIATKYREISQSKARLAMMEEALSMISTASRNRQNVRDVLPPEYLAILEDAEASDPEEPIPRRTVTVPVIEEEPEVEDKYKSSRRHAHSARMSLTFSPSLSPHNRGARIRDGATAMGRNEHNVRNEESREISAMQKRLNKTSTRVSAINEGSRQGHEKGAIKKQPQALWREGGANVDPRVSEMIAMQEELRQKKNALEALMRRMGKPSSLNMDNISDNISDNVSEPMDRLDGVSGTAATWGSGAMHDYSDNHYHQTSDEELLEEDIEGEVPVHSHRRPQQQLPPTPKDRNHQPAFGRQRRHHESSRLSVNNLATPQSERPKQNRFRSSSVPKAVWESVPTMDGRSYKSPSNTTLQAQQTIGSALSQLSQVQDTINGLRETLRHEQNQMISTSGGQYGSVVPQMMPDMATASLGTSPLPHMSGITVSGVGAVTPMSAYAGLGSLGLAGQAGGEMGSPMNQQMMSALQQCFSQLHLHSLEIQALSKHLQVRRPMFFPPYYPPYQ